SLPDYPQLVTRYGLQQLHIDMIRPASAGERTDDYLNEIMPRFSDMAPYIDAMLSRFEEIAPAFDINIGNYPYCVLPKWAKRIHHGGELTYTHSANPQGDIRFVWNKYEYQRSDMVYAEQCVTCVFKPQCRGVPAKYVQFYGTDELHPVSVEALRLVDVAQHFFVLQ